MLSNLSVSLIIIILNIKLCKTDICVPECLAAVLESHYQEALCCMRNAQSCKCKTNDIMIHTSTHLLSGIPVEKVHPYKKTFAKAIRRDIVTRFNVTYSLIHEKQYATIIAAKDPCTNRSHLLLNPVVIEIESGPAYKMMLMHCLGNSHYGIGLANSEAREEVHNKHECNFTGCYTTATHTCRPTCGVIHVNGVNVPYSDGFCCSCDPEENEIDQPGCVSEQLDLIGGIDYDIHLQPQVGADKKQCIGQHVDCLFDRKPDPRMKRRNPTQVRGGQDCINLCTPPNRDPATYHSSAHCLRFSDVWYNIYELMETSVVDQSYYVRLYERVNTMPNSKWKKKIDQTYKIDFIHRVIKDHKNCFYMKLKYYNIKDGDCYYQLLQRRLMIPRLINPSCADKYPEMRCGVPEYLVVPPDLIRLEGDYCDRVGVSYDAFFKQKWRCRKRRGSCLKNQPKHLWQHDKELDMRGMIGCYFLKFYGNFSECSFKEMNGHKVMIAPYDGIHNGEFTIQMKAFFNAHEEGSC